MKRSGMRQDQIGILPILIIYKDRMGKNKKNEIGHEKTEMNIIGYDKIRRNGMGQIRQTEQEKRDVMKRNKMR